MKKLISFFLFLATCSTIYPQYQNSFSNNNEKLNVIGRGECIISDGIFQSRRAYASFGDSKLVNYSFSFKARAPKDAEQVQIWAGFHANNRFDRYVVGMKGGLQDDLYLMRLGYMGADEFLGVRPLGFHPIPNEWYKLKVEVCGQRIRVFVNDEKKPHIDVVDKNASLASSGPVTLGGGWIETEFDDLLITPLDDHALDDVPREEYRDVLSSMEKEQKRLQERATYKPIKVLSLNDGRTDISLNGNWLFMPEYQQSDKLKAISPNVDDKNWHIMSVPNFWNPIRIWLHGETMPSPNGPQSKGVSDTYYQRETDRCENYTFDYRKTQAAWYRQWLELPNEVTGKNMVLTFDAISKIADIYINGQLAGSHIGMFGETQVDGSRLLKPGRNLITVKVIRNTDDNMPDSNSEAIDFFYSSVRESEKEEGKVVIQNNDVLKDIPHGFYGDDPAGIWQPVKLTITNMLKVEDVFIKPALDGAEFEVSVKNYDQKSMSFNLYTDIVDKETGALLYSDLSLENLKLKAADAHTFVYRVKGLKPRLWTPQQPNLYDFSFRLVAPKGKEIDCLTETAGFRTFVVKDGFFELNGHRYWLRGGNHTPFALAPNDLNLANTFMQWMKTGHIDVTRTHTTPWNKLWMEAADVNGIGVSFEGTWPWLMLHSTPLPDTRLLEMWKNEYLGLLKKYRNHPSLLFWTVNNEMKFYDNDNDLERAKEKFKVISDVVKEMRRIDPTRPICFDSNYQAKGKDKKFGTTFMDSVDDGDIDDMHAYYNWYDYSLFRFFNGEFQKRYKMPDRPLISQEMSTGYPNNETGHPTRSYQLIHQNPQSLIGYECYDFSDPKYFLKVQAFITGELAEALRRSNDQASGFMHFALLTWFRQSYDYQHIEPYPTYYALKRAFQPVLVSAELWGRNLYAGEKLQTRIYVVNDKEDGTDLQPTLLRWEIQDERGRKLAGGHEKFPTVKHSTRQYLEPEIQLPEQLPVDKMKVKLVLKLTENGLPVSANEYELLLARKSWNQNKILENKNIVLLDKDHITNALQFLNMNYREVSSVKELTDSKLKADLCIISGLEDCTEEEKTLLRDYQKQGGRLLWLNSPAAVQKAYPEHITDWLVPTEGDIVNMERNDHRVFDEIGVLDLRYFNNNRREIPLVCHTTLKVNRNENLMELAGQMKIHAYIDEGKPEDRIRKIKSMRGFTLLKIKDGKGIATISTICTEKADTDPIAGKLLVNLVNDLLLD